MDFLRKLGLNKYQSKAYETLVKLGSASAFQISKVSGVPFGRIYDSLNVLVARGLVGVIPSKPKKYEALSPMEALNSLIDEKLDELSLLRSQIKEFVQSTNSEGEKGGVSVSTGRQNFFKRVEQHFNFKEELWATSEEFRLEKEHPSIHRCTRGKLGKEFLLVDSAKADAKRLKKLEKQGLNIRHFPLSNVRILVSDEELITISFKDGEKWTNINVKSSSLGKALVKLLKTAWENARKI